MGLHVGCGVEGHLGSSSCTCSRGLRGCWASVDPASDPTRLLSPSPSLVLPGAWPPPSLPHTAFISGDSACLAHPCMSVGKIQIFPLSLPR